MASSDPFELLGVRGDASADEVRAARRTLAKDHHPDHGGDEQMMRVVNEAAAAAMLLIVHRSGRDENRTQDQYQAQDQSERHVEQQTHPRTGVPGEATGRVVRDMPSFTVEALPVETFEALLVVTSWLGEVLDEDPPYRLDTYLHEPYDCWCGLDVVPDAGGSTVSLAIAGVDGTPAPDVLDVRDAWIANLNAVDWP